MLYLLVCFLLIHGCFASPSDPNHPLHQRLHKWEILEEENIRFHRQKREVENHLPTLDQQLSFKAYDRQFMLSLMSSVDVLSPNFQATAANRRGERIVDVDKSTLYTGTVIGDKKSFVNAHIDGKTITAQIETNKETYILEPYWRHNPDHQVMKKQSKNMIIYRESDMKKEFSKPHGENGFCDTEKLMKDIREYNRENQHDSSSAEEDFEEILDRQKRQISAGQRNKVCNLKLYADYKFFKEMGNSNLQQTIYYLIQLIGRVNQIYKETNWDTEQKYYHGEFSGFGFQIDNITVFEESTLDPRFNSEKDDWNSNDLLKAFSEVDHSKLCLAHLFTYIDFDQGVLGLAYVGSDKMGDVGGICTKSYPQGSGKPVQYLNTGLTTTLNWGTRILTREADLVTAHELGHNFGAEHDSDTTKECSPGQSNNGNYVMYPAAVSGDYENNHKFSNCSKHTIFRTLDKKAPKCFKKEKKAFCGNYKVEGTEECDVGYIGHEDKCCNSECKLKPNAKCSVKNHVCCNNDCQPASTTTLCYSEVPDLCFRDTHCNGTSYDCPQRKFKAEGDKCGDMGECDAFGHCLPFCKTKGMQPCLCSEKTDEYCMRCCAPLGVTGKEMLTMCKPYIPVNGTIIMLRNNARCILGHCRDTVCIKQTQDVIERVWDIFEHIAPNKIGEFLADNIVGAVLVFSLLFWVPCGCLVHVIDKKRDKKRMKEKQWWTDKGNEFTRNTSHITGSMFLPAPPSAGINGQRINWSPPTGSVNGRRNWGGGVIKLGIGAKEQWKASQERGIAVRRARLQRQRSVELGDGDDNIISTPSISDSMPHPLAQSSPPLPRVTPRQRRHINGDEQVSRPMLQRQDNAMEETII